MTFIVTLVSIVFLSLTPKPPADQVNDKFAHFLAYGVAGVLAVAGFSTFRSRVCCLAFLLFVGASLELLQQLVPGRCFEVNDMVANSAGAGVALIAAWKFP